MTQSLVYLDTDISLGTPGAEIDDFAALLMLLRCPRITLAGIGSVFGNAPVEDVDTNLARLLNWLGRADIPTASGAAFRWRETCSGSRTGRPVTAPRRLSNTPRRSFFGAIID
jgi:inosine-uridine nucleoside N-ribohydrolase